MVHSFPRQEPHCSTHPKEMTVITELEADHLTEHIRDAIARTIEDLDAAGIQGDDRPVVLRAILDVRLGGSHSTSAAPGTAAAPSIGHQHAASASTLPPSQDDTLGKISGALKLDRELLEYVYDVQDGEPTLVISPKRLPDRKAEATKVIAQLVAAARQSAGLEDWTGAGTIRTVVGDYGRLDSNNFAAAIQTLDKVALSRGKGANRELKITRAGMEEIAALIASLVGDAG